MMRIDAYNQVMASYKPQNVGQPKKTSQSASMGRDQVQISNLGQDLGIAKNAVKESPDVREDLVAEMKAKYGVEGKVPDVDIDDFADKLLSNFAGAI